MIERNGKVKAGARLDKILSAKKMQALARNNVNLKASTIITDDFKGYLGFSKIVKHQVVDHTKCFTCGDIHTNSIESF